MGESIQSSQASFGQLFKVSAVGVEVVRFEIAICRRQRIEAIVGDYNALGILQFGEDFRFEQPVPLYVVAFGSAEGGTMCAGASGQHTYSCVLPALTNRVVHFQLLFLAAQFTGDAGAEIITQGKEYFGAKGLQQGAPGFTMQGGTQ